MLFADTARMLKGNRDATEAQNRSRWCSDAVMRESMRRALFRFAASAGFEELIQVDQPRWLRSVDIADFV